MRDDAGQRRGTLYRYRFGTAEFDESRFELCVDGKVVTIQRRPLEVLSVLLRHAGEVVTKEDLRAIVWAGNETVDNVFANALSKLRAALGPDNAARIVNVAGVGHRFDGRPERVVVGRITQSGFNLKAGQPVPGRENFTLERMLGSSRGSEVWIARQTKTKEVRVYKFSPDGERLVALKREATLARVLRESLGPREDLARVIDWNFETPPFFLELEFGGQNLIEWAAEDGRLRELPLQDRLALFLQLADIVADAHGVGVLHKDLRTSASINESLGCLVAAAV